MSNVIGLNLDMGDNYLADCVKETVIAGISASLNGKNEIVSQLVHDVLNFKVDKNGRVSGYQKDNQYTLLEWHVNHVIKEIAKDEIANMIEEARPKIAEAIKAELSKKKTMNDMVAAFVTTITNTLRSDWKTTVNIDFGVRDD